MKEWDTVRRLPEFRLKRKDHKPFARRAKEDGFAICELIYSIPEWPQRHWLEIPVKRRRCYLKRINDSPDSIVAMWSRFQTEMSFSESRIRAVRQNPCVTVRDSNSTFVAVHLRWDRTDAALLKGFKNLLKLRPKRERRGRYSVQDKLNQLSAFRLLKWFGSANACIDSLSGKWRPYGDDEDSWRDGAAKFKKLYEVLNGAGRKNFLM